MDLEKFSDLRSVLSKAKGATSKDDCEKYLNYFNQYATTVVANGSVVPTKYQEIQVELSNKLLNYNNNDTDNQWHKRPVGLICIAIISGIILLFIKHNFFTTS